MHRDNRLRFHIFYVFVLHFTKSKQQFLVLVDLQKRWSDFLPCQTKVWAQTRRRCRVWGALTNLAIEAAFLYF